MKKFVFLLALSLLGTSPAQAAPTNVYGFPAFGNDTNGPDLLIIINADGTATVRAPTIAPDGYTGQGPYDGADDTYVGVLNYSSVPITHLNLGGNTDLFGFDGDGIDVYGALGNSNDTTGYGGPNAFFTNYSSADSFKTGTVNFVFPISPVSGTIPGKGYFSLEEALDSSSGVTVAVTPVPEPTTLALFGVATLTAGYFGLRRRKPAFA